MDFSIEQSFTDLEPGTYELSAFSQGGDLAADASMELYAVVDGKELTVPFMLTTYADWQNPTVSGIKVTDSIIIRRILGGEVSVNRKFGVKSPKTTNSVQKVPKSGFFVRNFFILLV